MITYSRIAGSLLTGKPRYPVAGVLALVLTVVGCTGKGREVKRFHEFVERHEEKVRPIHIEYNLAWWSAATTGDEASYDKRSQLEIELTDIYSDREDFAYLKELRGKDILEDPIDRRILEVLYLKYLGNQIDPEAQREIIEKGSELEKTFTNFRAHMGGRTVSDNEIEEVLTGSGDSEERRNVWEASKQVGAQVATGLVELVRMRNRAARDLGYRDYFALSLALTEVDEAALFEIFDDLDKQTVVPFNSLKARLDSRLAERYEIAPGEIMPWHYADPFFQSAPDVTSFDLDALYADQDILKLLRDYYGSIGFEVGDIIDRSDLYEREGKNQHAFATDIDREGDVRTLMNLKPNARWMDTALHELGHGIYDKYVRREVPWLLRERSHSITTEGIAMMFGRFAQSAEWMESMGIVHSSRSREITTELVELSALQQLIFSRWCQVMVRFERDLYADPDRIDLDGLWWEYVGRYQGLVKPAGRANPDWASKIHFVVAPVYYHSYMLGELFASQLHASICRDIFGTTDLSRTCYTGEPRTGTYLIEKVFGPGNTMNWEGLIRYATGRPLSPDDFARQFMGGI